jgi:hypothetical protein
MEGMIVPNRKKFPKRVKKEGNWKGLKCFRSICKFYNFLNTGAKLLVLLKTISPGASSA